MEDHPLERLRAVLASDFTRDLPPSVEPIAAWCREPQFFPGVSGLPTETSWDEVQPGSRGMDSLPPAEGRDVMVVGNFQATVASYRRILQREFGGFPVTWRALRILLNTITPARVFLTNAHVGLLDGSSDVAKFPVTPSYLKRCQALLALEVELMQPRVVVGLGAPAARLIAAVTPQLHPWRPWPGFLALEKAGAQVVRDCDVSGVSFNAVAVHHPSAVRSRPQREADAQLIADAAA